MSFPKHVFLSLPILLLVYDYYYLNAFSMSRCFHDFMDQKHEIYTFGVTQYVYIEIERLEEDVCNYFGHFVQVWICQISVTSI